VSTLTRLSGAALVAPDAVTTIDGALTIPVSRSTSEAQEGRDAS
jgi:hypothetical protein